MNVHNRLEGILNNFLPLIKEEIATLEKRKAALEQFKNFSEEAQRVSEQLESYRNLRSKFEDGLEKIRKIRSGELPDITTIGSVRKLGALKLLLESYGLLSSDD